MNNILILGGTGFVGKNLAQYIAKNPNNSVSVVHRAGLRAEDKLPGVIYHQQDLAHRNIETEKVFSGKDLVIIMTQPDDAVIGNIIYYLRTVESIKKVVYVSSVLIYPSSPKPQDETSSIEAVSLYERGKREEESHLLRFIEGADVQLCIARLANVYGDARNRRIVGFVFDAAIDGKELKINGDGNQKRDYIFIDDAIRLLEFLIYYEQRDSVEVFNLCSGIGHTINDIVLEVESIVKHKIPVSYGPPILEKKEIIGDNKKILTASGINIEYDLTIGLETTYNRYLSSLK